MPFCSFHVALATSSCLNVKTNILRKSNHLHEATCNIAVAASRRQPLVFTIMWPTRESKLILSNQKLYCSYYNAANLNCTLYSYSRHWRVYLGSLLTSFDLTCLETLVMADFPSQRLFAPFLKKEKYKYRSGSKGSRQRQNTYTSYNTTVYSINHILVHALYTRKATNTL